MRLYIDNVGAFCSVGSNYRQTMGSLRTKYSRFQLLPIAPLGGTPLKAAPSPVLLGYADAWSRLLGLGGFALSECGGGADAVPMPMFLCVPDPHELPLDGRALLAELSSVAAVPLDLQRSEIILGGRAAIATALARANEFMRNTGLRACYVGAADTFLDATRLGIHLAQGRILSEATREGFIPGEAAVFLRLTASAGPGALAQVAGVGVSEERRSKRSGARSHGDGLSRAMRSALAAARLTMGDVGLLLTGATGERYDDAELGLVALRVRPVAGRPFDTTTVAMSVGEIGAALGPLSLAYGACMLRGDGLAPAPDGRPRSTLYAAADDGELRGAVILTGVHHGG